MQSGELPLLLFDPQRNCEGSPLHRNSYLPLWKRESCKRITSLRSWRYSWRERQINERGSREENEEERWALFYSAAPPHSPRGFCLSPSNTAFTQAEGITSSSSRHPANCRSFVIGGFHVTSSPPCWWMKTKDLSLSPFVRPPAFVTSVSRAENHRYFRRLELNLLNAVSCTDVFLTSLMFYR